MEAQNFAGNAVKRKSGQSPGGANPTGRAHSALLNPLAGAEGTPSPVPSPTVSEALRLSRIRLSLGAIADRGVPGTGLQVGIPVGDVDIPINDRW